MIRGVGATAGRPYMMVYFIAMGKSGMIQGISGVVCCRPGIRISMGSDSRMVSNSFIMPPVVSDSNKTIFGWIS